MSEPEAAPVPARADAGTDEVLRRLDVLANLFVQKITDDRGQRTAVETLTEQLRLAESGGFRRHLYPFVMGAALVIDRLDSYEGPDPGFVQSIRNELLDVLARFGVHQVNTAGYFDPAQHEAVETRPATTVPPGTVVESIRRGFVYDTWVFRPALVVVSAPPT